MTIGDAAVVGAILFLAFKETIMGQVHYAKKWIRRRIKRWVGGRRNG